MANPTAHGDRASDSHKFVFVDFAVQAEAIKIELSLAEARQLVETARTATSDVQPDKKVIKLAEAFIAAAGYYSSALNSFVRECTASTTPANRQLGWALGPVLASTPQASQDQEQRIRAEFTVQSKSSTAQRCYEFRSEAYRAYTAAAHPPSGQTDAAERKPLFGAATFAGFLRLSRV